jgi:type I restriction enzyme S subunit
VTVDMEELPEGWARAKLGELASPSSEKVEPKEKPDARYLSLEHIEPHTGRILGFGYGTDVNSTKAVFRAGDVLYGKLRPYLNKVSVPDFGGICSTDILVFPRKPWIDSDFLRRFLSTSPVVEFANHNSSGVQLPRISFTQLSTIDVPFPPLAEQKRIVAKVEEVLERVTAAHERLAKAPAILKRFRQAVLAAACAGRLTSDWREDEGAVEPATSLLNRLAEERCKLWKERNANRKYRPPDEMEPDELSEIPESWAWTNFDHCAWEITVGHVGPMKERYVKTGISFLRSQNVRPLRFDPAGLVFIKPDFHAALRKSTLYGGELLVTRSGANTGDCCVFPITAGEANCADLVVTRTLSGLLPAYGAIYVSSPDGQRRIGLRETGMAQPHFNIGAMRVKPFPLPPLCEQHEIIRRVSALFKLADVIEQRLSAASRQVDKLTQAVLAKAFRGGLVPTEAELARVEGRDYEPASVLLDRVRAERAASTSPKPSRRRKT